MSFKLPVNLYTPDQIQVCAEELHALANHQRRATKTGTDTVGDVTTLLLETLPVAVRSQPEALDALGEELEKVLARSPRVSITLPALASHTLREELVAWLREHIREDLVVVFHANPDIAGGMVVRTTNKVHDFSFRARLLERPERFTEQLLHV